MIKLVNPALIQLHTHHFRQRIRVYIVGLLYCI